MSHNNRLLGSQSNPMLLANTNLNNSRINNSLLGSASVGNLNAMLTNVSKYFLK